jgi:hypothetical protein
MLHIASYSALACSALESIEDLSDRRLASRQPSLND